jgi:DNA-binding response OmpR family regulator
MERLDQKLAAAIADTPPSRGPASALLILNDPELAQSIARLLEHGGHRCYVAASAEEAAAQASRRRFDVAFVQTQLPDASGFDVAATIIKQSPTTSLVFIGPAREPQLILAAMRVGAIDYFAWPFDEAELKSRVEAAIARARADHHREVRIKRLKKICQELNEARHQVSKQVDSLCDDLVIAYREMSDQLDDVAMASEFRTLMRQELDVEDLLRTMLEYLLTRTGPTNAAVFLPDHDKNFSLGAYVNYDCPRESVSILLDHLCDLVCPQMMDESDLIAFEDAAEFCQWIGGDAELLNASQIIAYSCMHEGECLAVCVLFRNQSEPFPEDAAAMLNTIRTIFAEQLSRLIKVHHRAKPSWPKTARGEKSWGYPADNYDEDDRKDDDFDTGEDGYTGLAA